MSRLILVFIFLFHKAFSSSCPLNGVSSLNGGNKCYYFFSIGGDFMEAERTCQEQGGHLVSVCSAFDNNFLMDIASQRFEPYGEKDFWIGYNDLIQSGVWNWTNPNASCSYTNGNFGPSGGNDCAAFSISSGKWAPNDCSVRKPFVCEIKSSTNTISTPICPPGYSYFHRTNFCYKFVTKLLGYDEAESNCQNDSADGHLVSIHSPEENEFIDSLSLQYPGIVDFWIGLYNIWDSIGDFFWIWTDQTSLCYNDYSPGYVKNVSTYYCTLMLASDYAGMNGKSLWGDIWPCTNKYASICKTRPICSS